MRVNQNQPGVLAHGLRGVTFLLQRRYKYKQHHFIYLFIISHSQISYFTGWLCHTLSGAVSAWLCVLDPQVWGGKKRKSSLISHLQVAFQPDRVRTLRYSIDLNHRYQGVSSHICTHTHARTHAQARRQTVRHARGNVHISFLLLPLLILLFMVLVRDVEAKQQWSSRWAASLRVSVDVFTRPGGAGSQAGRQDAGLVPKSTVRWCHCSSATCANCIEEGEGKKNSPSSSCSKCYVILVRKGGWTKAGSWSRAAPPASRVRGVVGTCWGGWCKGEKAEN